MAPKSLRNELRIYIKYEVSSWCIFARVWTSFKLKLAPKFFLGAFRAALGRCLRRTWKHLGSVLVKFSRENETKMHLNLTNLWFYAETARKLKTFERKVAPKFLLAASRAALGLCLGPTWEHLGSVSVRFSCKNGSKIASKSDKSFIFWQNCSKAKNCCSSKIFSAAKPRSRHRACL